jgi:suppressor for copper-sensitivity B
MRHQKTIHPLLLLIRIAVISLILLPLHSFAQQQTGWLTNPAHPPVKTRFVLTGQVNPEQKLVEGFLEIELSGDWKTYWRSPGEGGVAPSIDWSKSTNLADVDWHWPYPKQFELLGIHTLGYKGDTVIPITLRVEDWSKPVVIDALLTQSTCTTVCVLTDYPIKLSFTPQTLLITEDEVYLHAKAMSKVPKASPLISQPSAKWDANSQILEVSVNHGLDWYAPEMIVDGRSEQSKEYSYKLVNQTVEGNRATATFYVDSWLGDVSLDSQTVNVSISDKDFLAEQAIDVEIGLVNTASSYSLMAILGFALLGGLILNVMPCVLPVLGMKLSSVITAQGLKRRQIRAQFLASSAGILTSFWLLAAFLLVLKLSGNAIGWGIQFQSPWFIGLMVSVTALFGANMLGLFEIRLSANSTTWIASQGGHGYAGHFVQGMFATLLATPCSAPFLGTAVAFALGASAAEMFAIFTALAAGMAMPWIIIALFPSLASLLPKPGAWMNKVKISFGIMMLITTLWLLSLLSSHLPVFWLFLATLILVIALLKRVRAVYGSKTMAVTGSGLLLLTVGTLIIGSMTTKHWATPLPADLAWQPLSQEFITQQVSQGDTVFVNVTADWCVTCKANKIGVILQDPVYSALKQESIVKVQGDWTHPNSTVTDYLRANGRFGVPFNIVYGPAAPEGIPLPVILTSDEVMRSLQLAKTGQAL